MFFLFAYRILLSLLLLSLSYDLSHSLLFGPEGFELCPFELEEFFGVLVETQRNLA